MRMYFESHTKMKKIFVGEVDMSNEAQTQEYQANLRVENVMKGVFVKSVHRRYAVQLVNLERFVE